MGDLCKPTSSVPQPQINSAPIDNHICTKIVENSRHIILFPQHANSYKGTRIALNQLPKLYNTCIRTKFAK